MRLAIEPTSSELLASRIAAGALFLLLLAFAGLAAARPAHHVAKLSVLPAAAASGAHVARPGATGMAATSLDTLGMGDMVRITVFRNPDLTTEARVSERGTVLFPLIGEVPVAGMTTTQAGSRIAQKLKGGGFVVDPEVTVALMQVNSRQVSVLGNVNKPGRYPLDSQTSHLTDFLAMAGGVAAPGSDKVTIISNDHGQTTKKEIDLVAMFRNGDMSQNVSLHAGDTIFVEKAPMVYVYGEVQKAGAYRLEPHMTVMQAVASAGSVTTRGTLRGIKIARRDGAQVKEIDARLTDPVQSDDVVYVSESLF